MLKRLHGSTKDRLTELSTSKWNARAKYFGEAPQLEMIMELGIQSWAVRLNTLKTRIHNTNTYASQSIYISYLAVLTILGCWFQAVDGARGQCLGRHRQCGGEVCRQQPDDCFQWWLPRQFQPVRETNLCISYISEVLITPILVRDLVCTWGRLVGMQVRKKTHHGITNFRILCA